MPALSPARFDNETLVALQRAFEDACTEIGIDPSPAGPTSHSQTREALAKAVMVLASTGERDPARLRLGAIYIAVVTT